MSISERRTDRAFSLIETIMVVALVALLVALLLPVLSSVSDRARMLRAQSDLRQHAQVVQMYAGDYHDTLPFFAYPDATLTILRGPWGAVSLHYFGSYAHWPYALADAYYQSMDPWHELFASPYHDINNPDSGATAYYYSCSLIASPAYWNPETRLAGTSQLRPVRLDHVRYASSKALFAVDPWASPFQNLSLLPRDQLRSAIAAIDGRSKVVPVSELGPTIQSGDGTGSSATGHVIGWTPSGMHTLDGAHGRDLR